MAMRKYDDRAPMFIKDQCFDKANMRDEFADEASEWSFMFTEVGSIAESFRLGFDVMAAQCGL